jgi:sec-independent protein translocase protein TatA
MFAMILGPTQIIVLLLLGILLFGKRLPEVGRPLAKTLRELQDAWGGIKDDVVGTVLQTEKIESKPRPAPRISGPVPNRDGRSDSTPSA